MLVWCDEHNEYQDAQKLLSNAPRVLEFEASELRGLLRVQSPSAVVADLLGLRAILEGLQPCISRIACGTCGKEITPWSEVDFGTLGLFAPNNTTQFLIVVELNSTVLRTELGAIGYLDMIGARAVIINQKIVRRTDFDQELFSNTATLLAVLSVSSRTDFDLKKIRVSYPVLDSEAVLQLWQFSREQEQLNLICEIESDYFCEHCKKSSSPGSILKLKSGEFLYWEDFCQQPIDQILKLEPEAIAQERPDSGHIWQQLLGFLSVLSAYQLGSINLFSAYQELSSVQRFALFLAASTLKQVPDLTLVFHNLDRVICEPFLVQELLQKFESFGAQVILLSNSSSEKSESNFLQKLPQIKVLKSAPLNAGIQSELLRSDRQPLILINSCPLVASELSSESSSLISYLGIWSEYREMLKFCVLPGNPQLELKLFDGLKKYSNADSGEVLPVFNWRGLSPQIFVQLTAKDFLKRADFLRPESFLRIMRVLEALNIEEFSLFQPIFEFPTRYQRRLLLAKAIFDANVHSARKDSCCLVFDQSLIDWADSELYLFEALLDLLATFQAEVIVLDSSGRLFSRASNLK